MRSTGDKTIGGRRRIWVGAIAALMCLACGVILYFTYSDGVSAAEDDAGRIFAEAAGRAQDRINALLQQAVVLSRTGAGIKGVEQPVAGDGQAHPAADFLTAAVMAGQSIYAVYYGFTDGSFLEAIATRGDASIIKDMGAPPGTELVIRSIVPGDGGTRTQSWTYRDKGGTTLGTKLETQFAYDPRTTDWFRRGRDAAAPTVTQPYLYSSIHALGVTVVQKLPSDRGVFGVDVTLSALSRFVADQRVSTNGAVYLFDDSLRLVAAPSSGPGAVPPDRLLADMRTLGLPVLQMLAELPKSPASDVTRFVKVQSRPYAAYLSQWHGAEGAVVNVAVAAPLADFTDRIGPSILRTLLVTAVILGAGIPLVAWSLRRRA